MNEQQLYKYTAFLSELEFSRSKIEELYKFANSYQSKYYQIIAFWCVIYCVAIVYFFYTIHAYGPTPPKHINKQLMLIFTIFVTTIPSLKLFQIYFFPEVSWQSLALEFHKKAINHALSYDIVSKKPDGYQFIQSNFNDLSLADGFKSLCKPLIKKQIGFELIIGLFFAAIMFIFGLVSLYFVFL